MSLPVLFLVDMRQNKSAPLVCEDLSARCKLILLDKLELLDERISNNRPDVLCFEFDLPDNRSLQVLEKTKHTFPSIPILMVTEYHDEQLAVWALRARVWDYLVKPVSTEDVFRSLSLLAQLRSASQHNNLCRDIIKPQQLNSDIKNFHHFKSTKNTTFNVIRYVENHYHEKIYIAEMAEQCRISQHQFSRVFKREKGITFREFLAHYRLARACELLADSELSVGDVGYAVGFSDHSYFTRMFRKHVGVSPSDYRSRKN